MVRKNRFISALLLRGKMTHRLQRRLSVWSIANRLLASSGYQSRRPAKCPSLTLYHRRRRRLWGRSPRNMDLRYWKHCVFSDESRFTLFYSHSHVRVHHRQEERPIYTSNTLAVTITTQSHHGERSDLVVVDGNQCYIRRKHSSEELPSPRKAYYASLCVGRSSDERLRMSNAIPCPTQHVTWLLFWHKRMWRSWTGQLGVQAWTPLSMFGTKWGFESDTWMTLRHCERIAECYPPSAGFSSPRKCEYPGGCVFCLPSH